MVQESWPERGTIQYQRCSISTGLTMLLCAQVLRPSFPWLLAQHFTQALVHARSVIDPDGFARLEAHCDATGRAGGVRNGALGCIAMILFSLGGKISDITVDGCVAFCTVRRVSHRSARHVSLLYALLFETGVFASTAPANLPAARSRGQRPIVELVDSYGLKNTPIHELLIAYLTVRKPDLDYTSLRSLTSLLCMVFWRDIELHHPDVDTLRLPADVIAAWKERIQVNQHSAQYRGKARERPERVLASVRAFYLDLAQWALEDPARWGPWVAPCPIRANECLAVKQNRRRRARIHQRIRTLAPALPALVGVVEQRRKTTSARLEAALAVDAGTAFVFENETFIRSGHRGTKQVFAFEETGRRRDLTYEEDNAFWAWATVEVLRHTGLRVEELQELTHHSFIAYTLPTTGEVVPMRQVAPSKTDAERLVLVSPELGEVLAAIIHRIRRGKAALPLVSCYDRHERIHSALMPFLFQRFRHGIEATVSRNFHRHRVEQRAGRERPDRPGRQPATVHPARLQKDLRHRRDPHRTPTAHRGEDPRSRQHQHHDGLRGDLSRGRHRPPSGIHRAAPRAAAGRRIPRPHRPGVAGVPRALRAAQGRTRHLHPRLRHALHPRARLLNRNDLGSMSDHRRPVR